MNSPSSNTEVVWQAPSEFKRRLVITDKNTGVSVSLLHALIEDPKGMYTVICSDAVWTYPSTEKE